MMKVRNLGRKSLEEVLAKLKELGLELSQETNNELRASGSREETRTSPPKHYTCQ